MKNTAQSIHLSPQKGLYSVLNRSHISICSVIPCGIKTFLEKNLNTLRRVLKCFFLGGKTLLEKRQVLTVSTGFFIAVVFISVFSVSPLSAAESLVNPQTAVASPDVTANILKVSAGLLLVIFAIFGSAWFYRRFGNFSPVATDSLKVIGGLTMGQKEKIVLLQVGEEQVLIGVAPGNIQKLHVLEKPIELNEKTGKDKNSFSSSLGEAMGKSVGDKINKLKNK